MPPPLPPGPPRAVDPRPGIAAHVVAYRGAVGLTVMRDRVAPLCALTTLTSSEEFAAWTAATLLGPAILFESRMTGLVLDRSPVHVARAAIDAVQVSLLVRGRSEILCGRRAWSIDAGDIAIMDLACSAQTRVEPARDRRATHQITLHLPRALLGAPVARREALAGCVVRGATPYGRILRAHLLGAWRQAARLDASERDAVARTAAALVAARLTTEADDAQRERAELATRRQQIIDVLDASSATADDVDVDAVARALGLSRASVYRAFEADAGLVRYLRERQLRRALAALESQAAPRRRIVEVALEHGFRTESGFIRAFRRRFGLTPGEARDAARTRPGRGGSVRDEPSDPMRWILGEAAPARGPR